MPATSPLSHAAPIVGIDLGTTNSLVAVAYWGDDPAPRTLDDPRPGRAPGPLLPSIVRLPDAPGVPPLIGQPARAGAADFPHTTIHSVKRLMGRSLSDVQRSGDLAYLGYTVVAPDPARPEHGQCLVALPSGPAVTPQEISAQILRELRERASAALGVSINRAVITVPAYFDDAQRQATRDAGRIAGLEVLRIINEPTAAALAYGLGLREAAGTDSPPRSPRTVVVFDLGGGTFDVSILRLTPAGHDGLSHGAEVFQVLATAGDTHLGGDDMDHALVALFLRELAIGDPPAELRQRLRAAAEACKVTLSTEPAAEVYIDLDRAAVGSTPPTYQRTVTRAEFESLIVPLVERALATTRRAVRDARRALADEPIDAMILVGGATRVPLVRRSVAEAFNLTPYTALDPDRVVALGAAVQAAVLAAAAPAASSAPHPQTAAAAAALLLDVIPLSLGIETVGGAVAKLIVRNSTVPARATERFSTSVDNQTAISLHVLQGEREMAADCRSLGIFHLRGIPPMPAGTPRLVVEFFVDASGILAVSAIEERSGVRADLQVVPNHGLTPEQIARMEAESLSHARDDMTRHRVVDLVANSKLALHWTDRQLSRVGAILPPALGADLKARIDSLRAFITAAEHDWRTVDPNAFHAAKEGLEHASIPLHETAIAQTLRDGPAPPAGPT